MRKIIISLTLAVVLLLSFTLPAMATTINNPDSISILSCQVTRNNIESGDMTFAFHFKIAYTSGNITTEVSAADAFYLYFYDTDGITLLASTVPYVYEDNGFNDNLASFYFDAATAASMTWGAAYQISIEPNPVYFVSPPADYDYTLGLSNYSTKTTQVDNQKVMKDYLVNVLKKFQTYYTGLTLLTNTDVGYVLTIDGENWMRGSLPGVASWCPSLFYIQYYVPQSSDMGYDSSLGTTYASRSSGWDITTGLDYLATITGLDSAGTVAIFLFAIICLVFTVFCGWKGWGIEPGLLGSMNILECGALLFGGSILNIVLFGSLIGGIFIFFILFLRRG